MSIERRYDIDWLRIFATYLLFPFHVSKVFDMPPNYPIKNAELSWGLAYFTGNYPIKNAELSWSIACFTTFVHQWHMPLFFLLAGWSLNASMSFRDAGWILRERVRRLVVPLVFGCCTYCVFLGYIGKVLMTGQDLTFLEFLPKFFTSTDYFTWSQLWFLAYLFTFTILYMPLFLWLKRVNRDKVGGTGAPLPRPSVAGRVWLYAPLGPLLLIQLALRARWPGLQNLYDDWANFAYYSSFFIMGFLLGRHPEIEDAIGREWKRAGKVGLALSVVFLLAWSQRQWNDGVRYLLYYTLGTATGYCLLLGMLGFARAHLCFGNRAQKYLAESALPVYLLHQGCIVFPGYAIIQFAWGIPAKLSLLLPLSFLLTMSAYHFLVRPFNTLRFLFGMKRRASPPLAPALRNP